MCANNFYVVEMADFGRQVLEKYKYNSLDTFLDGSGPLTISNQKSNEHLVKA